MVALTALPRIVRDSIARDMKIPTRLELKRTLE